VPVTGARRTGGKAVRTIAARIVDSDVVAAIGRRRPTDEDWDGYVRLVECAGIARAVVYSDGGLPTIEQQSQLGNVLVSGDVPIAVVSDRLRVRAFAFLLSFASRRVRGFPASELRAALAYLHVPTHRRDHIARELQSLRRETSAA
jgi:hypothetical protein